LPSRALSRPQAHCRGSSGSLTPRNTQDDVAVALASPAIGIQPVEMRTGTPISSMRIANSRSLASSLIRSPSRTSAASTAVWCPRSRGRRRSTIAYSRQPSSCPPLVGFGWRRDLRVRGRLLCRLEPRQRRAAADRGALHDDKARALQVAHDPAGGNGWLHPSHGR
jgi:hypothetical protein